MEYHGLDCRYCENGQGVLTLRVASTERDCPIVEAAYGREDISEDPCSFQDIKSALTRPDEPVDLNTCLFTRPFFHCPSCKLAKEKPHGQGDTR